MLCYRQPFLFWNVDLGLNIHLLEAFLSGPPLFERFQFDPLPPSLLFSSINQIACGVMLHFPFDSAKLGRKSKNH